MELNKVKIEFEKLMNLPAIDVQQIPQSGSNREYFRVFTENKSFIFTANSNIAENESFIELSNTFLLQNLNVPQIYAVSDNKTFYVQTDFGDISLYATILKYNHDFDNAELKSIFKKVIVNLQKFQLAENISENLFFSSAFFDQTAMTWDLNYFKYYFLKLAYVPFDEAKLEEDFKAFTNLLSAEPFTYFMYRDFQTRNVMIKDGNPFFIDYQGGRFGALQYDLASLLYDAKANLSPAFRNELIDYYCKKLQENTSIDIVSFRKMLPLFIVLRILQNFGAYGYRGFYEKKAHFMQSIPFAANNLKNILTETNCLCKFVELKKVCEFIVDKFANIVAEKKDDAAFRIKVSSISIKKAYPDLDMTHGGGFVFDCRCLPNPGRDKYLSQFNGKDALVVKFLDESEPVQQFVQLSLKMLKLAIENYIDRKFNYLSVAFGCTGGRHRSVYCAETIARELKYLYGNGVIVEVDHRELEK